MSDLSYPLRHVSVRVPWHDNGWNGSVCKDPKLLDCFWCHVKPQQSLVFFYVKQVPFVEDTGRRVLIGVGSVKTIGELTEYRHDDEPDAMDRIEIIARERGPAAASPHEAGATPGRRRMPCNPSSNSV